MLIMLAPLTWGQYVPLSFDGGDPDSGDTVTYDVSFSTDSTFSSAVYHAETQAPWNVTRISVASPPVLPLTTYYWWVRAIDSQGAYTDGNIWRFTTSGFDPDEPPPYLIIKQTIYLKRKK